jgi:hypothetical protein
MRGPVAASITAVMTVLRQSVEVYGIEYNAAVPVAVVVTILLVEHGITLFIGKMVVLGGPIQLQLLQNVEERLLTQGDLRQFLESSFCSSHHMAQSHLSLHWMFLSLLVTAGRPLMDLKT